jgi:hypothetical protein
VVEVVAMSPLDLQVLLLLVVELVGSLQMASLELQTQAVAVEVVETSTFQFVVELVVQVLSLFVTRFASQLVEEQV